MANRILHFQNCHLLRDHKIIKDDLWVRDRKIINPEPLFFEEKAVAHVLIDCKGALIAPGFIDVQINGGFGVDFSHHVHDVESGVAKVAQGILPHGVTSFCPTLVTSSPDKYRKILPYLKPKRGGRDGAGILGVHVEGPFISREKKGAHSVQYIRNLNGIEDVLNVYSTLENVKVLTLAPELDPEGKVIEELTKRGITVSLGHSSGNLLDGERAVQYGANFITHLFNAMLPFHHRDPGLVGLLTSNKLRKSTIYYGIISDGIHTHPAALRIAFKANPQGLVLVTDAVSAMGLEEGKHFIGEMEVEIKGNCAYIAGTDTLCGSIASMNCSIQFFQKATGCSKVEALECASLHPAQALGIQAQKGTLEFGTDADFVLLDENMNVLSTFIEGECVWEKKDNSYSYQYRP